LNTEWGEVSYDIKLMNDDSGSIIEDTLYKGVLDDMELFGEALVLYLNTI
jgi:hypothetical protein